MNALSLACDRLEAPAHWQAIDLLSDLHLCPALPRTTEAFQAHLAATDADAVLILGDLFEVWIGDDQRHQDLESSCLRALKQAAAGRWIGIMVGNRDFLLGPSALKDAGAHRLDDPLALTAFGQRFLLSHGDALCLADTEYQQFRQQVRQTGWQQEFLARPYAERSALAQAIRAESRTRKAARPQPSDWADVDSAAASTCLDRAAAGVLIHGHTHRPADHALPGGRVRHVLSDWDMDGPTPRAEVVRIDRQGVHRRAPSRLGAPGTRDREGESRSSVRITWPLEPHSAPSRDR